MPIQIRRTRTPNLAPSGLLPGQLSVEMASNPPRLWVGVPASIDPTLRREIAPFGAFQAWSTGDIKLTMKTAPDVGWLMCDDSTIGNVDSGANFANAAARNLFLLLYDAPFTDAIIPIFTSANATTTRAAQGTPANAWTNNVRLRLALMLGRSLGVAGTGAGLSARTPGQSVGAEIVGLDANTLPAHLHSYIGPYTYAAQGPGGVGYTMSGTGWTGYTGGSGAHNNMQPTTFLNAMICL